MIHKWKEGFDYVFPSLIVRASVENWEEDDHCLLTFKTPVLECFESAGKKALYFICVKVSNARLLTGVFSTKWILFLDLNLPLKAAGALCTITQSISGQVTCSGELYMEQ